MRGPLARKLLQLNSLRQRKASPDRGGKPTAGGEQSEPPGEDIESKGALQRAKDRIGWFLSPFSASSPPAVLPTERALCDTWERRRLGGK
jgi:hypothetical protein